MQPDPIGYGDGMNLYAYVRGDAVNLVDPTGMTSGCIPRPGSRIRDCSAGAAATGFVSKHYSDLTDEAQALLTEAVLQYLLGIISLDDVKDARDRLQPGVLLAGASQIGQEAHLFSYLPRTSIESQHTDREGYITIGQDVISSNLITKIPEYYIGFWNSDVKVITYTAASCSPIP